MFLHVSVILFTGGGVPWQVSLRAGTPPWDTVNKRAVHILLECILVRSNSTFSLCIILLIFHFQHPFMHFEDALVIYYGTLMEI